MESLLASDTNKGDVIVFYDNNHVRAKQMSAKMIRYAYSSGADCMVFCEDDIVYNKNWLNYMLEIKDEIPNLGILSPWHRRGTPTKGRWGYANNVRAVCRLLTRSFVEKLLKEGNMDKWRGQAHDTEVEHYCHKFGFRVAVTIPSYVEHFGVYSVGFNNFRRETSRNFIGEE